MGSSSLPAFAAHGLGPVLRHGFAALLQAWALFACAPTTTERVPEPAAELEALRVIYTGCMRITTGPTCLRGEGRELSVWVQLGEAPQLWLDTAEVGAPRWALHDVAWTPRVDGLRGTITPDGARALEIRAPGHPPWGLSLRNLALDEDILRAQQLLQSREAEGRREAVALLQQARTRGSYEEAEATRLLSMLPTTGVTVEYSETAAEVAGLWFLAAVAVGRQVHAGMIEREGLQEILSRMDAYERRAGGNLGATVQYTRAFQEGQVHQVRGDHLAAHLAFDKAGEVAEAIGRASWVGQVRRRKADSYVRSGEVDQARALMDEAAAGAEESCMRHKVAIDAAWVEVQAQRLGVEMRPDVALLSDALAASIDGYSSGRCGDGGSAKHNLAHARLHGAVLASRAGDAELAWARVAEVRGSLPDRDPELLETIAELTARHGEPKAARRAYEALFQEVRPDQLEYRSRALAGRARTLLETGDVDEAIDDFLASRELFFDQGLVVPVHLGRANYFALARTATYDLARLLVEVGRPRDALDAIRDLRVQHLNGILDFDSLGATPPPELAEQLAGIRAAREVIDDIGPTWQIPINERPTLVPRRDRAQGELQRRVDTVLAMLGRTVSRVRSRPEPGEALITWMEGSAGWLVLVERDGVVTPAQGAPHERLDTILGRLAPQIEGAKQVSLVPYDRDLIKNPTTVRVGDNALIDLAPVRVRLDASAAQPWSRTTGSALIVSDPESNLANAAEEGARLQSLLQERGWAVTLLAGEAATHQAVRDWLPNVQLFVYAGHARDDDELGVTLSLSRGRLAVADVLALSRVPEAVVLNGCDTGRASGAAVIGLAQSFLAKGSVFVVATTDPVGDGSAAMMSRTLAKRLIGASLFVERRELLAFRAALQDLRAAGKSDWRRFVIATQ